MLRWAVSTPFIETVGQANESSNRDFSFDLIIALDFNVLVTVTRLIRVAYGDYDLKKMRPGMALEIACKPIEKQHRKGPLSSRKRPTKANIAADDASSVEWVSYKQNS